jgi:hypothetical protein
MPSRITAGMDIAAVKDYGIGLRLTAKRLDPATLWRSVATAVRQSAADAVNPVVRLLLLKEIVAVVETAGVEPSNAQHAADIAGALQKAVSAIPASVGTAERVALRQAALEFCDPKPLISSWIRSGVFSGWTPTTLLETARGVQRKLGLPTLLRFEVGDHVIALCSSKWLACDVVVCYDGNLGGTGPVYEVRVTDADRNGRDEILRGAVVPVATDGQLKDDDGTFCVVDSVACATTEESDEDYGMADMGDTARASSDAHEEADGELGDDSDAEEDEAIE